ncbi:hypothetical protein MJ588_15440 [Klebsiella pneumoniae]|nr:hypothetical protein MJ588_15440 [Klebsiella pneumoniae]
MRIHWSKRCSGWLEIDFSEQVKNLKLSALSGGEQGPMQPQDLFHLPDQWFLPG